MRLRLPMLAAALTAAATLFALPASHAVAAVTTPCVDLGGVVVVGCTQSTPAAARPAEECPGATALPTAKNLATVRTATVCLVNAERTKRGLAELTAAPSLQGAAATYAHRMVAERFFGHTSPKGETFLTRIKATSYLHGTVRQWSVGENLAWGGGSLATPEAIVEAWMHSPGHRRNILTPGFRELGVGVALGTTQGGKGATYVNEFGARQR